MSRSKEERLERWAATRKKGMGRYILLHGVIGSLPMVVLMAVIMWRFFPPSAGVPTSRVYLGWLSLLLGFGAAGVTASWSQWRRSESEFMAAQERQKS